ncbi:proproteinase E-like [Phyllostomus discolor]|uniref:Proproteinase E-like n=1 Tax=Phyllostomus discolor TaxID=89673 RepID=A0A7E6DQC8_9CHIR|nr:proproteinase E-like [Phyllostomus discolor]
MDYTAIIQFFMSFVLLCARAQASSLLLGPSNGLTSRLSLPASGCGRPSFNPSTRVVNGQDAVPYSWPWQISLQYEKNGDFHHTCGGTLIDPDWVMTAGHCVSSSLTYQVVLGEYDRSTKEGPEQVIPINAEDLFVHPLWNPKCVSCGNDIALIKLSRPAQLGDSVKLACLPPADDILPNEAPCYISGWGRLSTGGPLPDKLQQALLPVVDYEHCSKWDWWGISLKKTMVCAGGDIRSGCNGDSGGPLNCPAADGSWQVHGVASFVSSLGCNARKKPTVFTRVSAFNDWIQETIASH